MTQIQSKSPDGLEFSPRHPGFEIEAALATDWHGGSAFRTAWFNAMSMLFPLGEKFFIDTVGDTFFQVISGNRYFCCVFVHFINGISISD